MAKREQLQATVTRLRRELRVARCSGKEASGDARGRCASFRNGQVLRLVPAVAERLHQRRPTKSRVPDVSRLYGAAETWRH